MKVTLIYPPHIDPLEPRLGAACVAGHLRHLGHEVALMDLNIEFLGRWLDNKKLARFAAQARERVSALQARGWKPPEGHELVRLPDPAARLAAIDWAGLGEFEAARAELRSLDAFRDPSRYQRAYSIIGDALDVASLAHAPSHLTFAEYRTPYSWANTADILAAADDVETNLYHAYFRDHALPKIAAARPGVVGFSIISPFQVIPAVTLARMLKRVFPHVHVTVGGAYLTYLAAMPERLRPLLEHAFDSVVFYEGERAAAALCEAVEGRRALGDVPNLVWFDGVEVRANKAEANEDLRQLATPSFDGLDLGAYFAPRLVLPLESSRGCYYGKCSFCSDPRDWLRYRHRPEDLLVQDVQDLHARYGARHFMFTDDAFPPSLMRRFCQRMAAARAQGLDVSWCSMIRFERVWTAEDFQLMAAAGCTRVMIGFETGSERMIGIMRKGTDHADSKRNLRDLAAAGISVHLFTLVDHPGETMEDHAATLAYLDEMHACVASVGFGGFIPFALAPITLKPQEFGIELRPLNPDDDVPLIYDYVESETRMGMRSRQEERNAKLASMRALVDRYWPFDPAESLYPLPRFLDDAPEPARQAP